MSETAAQRDARKELLAAQFLPDQGLNLVASNYRTRLGEIALIMEDGRELVFVEVRYRLSAGFGSAADSVTAVKRRRLVRAAQRYLQDANGPLPACRFDVVAISGPDDKVDWLPAAFMPE